MTLAEIVAAAKRSLIDADYWLTRCRNEHTALRVKEAVAERERLTEAKRQLASQIRQAANLPERNLGVSGSTESGRAGGLISKSSSIIANRGVTVLEDTGSSTVQATDENRPPPSGISAPPADTFQTKAQENAEAVNHAYPNGRYSEIGGA